MQQQASPRRRFLTAGLAVGGAALAPRMAAAADVQPPAAALPLTAAPTSQAGASPRLTFHAVDTFSGATAAGLKLDLLRFEAGAFRLLKTVEAAAGGRTAEPLLVGDTYQPGRYEILVARGRLFRTAGRAAAGVSLHGAAAHRDPRCLQARAPAGAVLALGLFLLPRELRPWPAFPPTCSTT